MSDSARAASHRVSSHRVSRVDRELLQLSSDFVQNKMGQPLPAFVSVTAVETSPDLRHAKIFFRIVGESADQERSEAILDNHRPLLQKEVAKNLKMKFCPVLKFVYGRVDGLSDIDLLLANLKKR